MNKSQQLKVLRQELAELYKEQAADYEALTERLLDEAINTIQRLIVSKNVEMASPTALFVEFRFPSVLPKDLNRLWLTETAIPERMKETWDFDGHVSLSEVKPLIDGNADPILYTYWFSFDEDEE